jgi:hydrogenase maturation protease
MELPGAWAGREPAIAARLLVLGWGNPGRRDDGLGPAIVEELAGMGIAGVNAESDYQLSIEAAADLAEAERAVFVDAALEGPEPFQVRPLEPSPTIGFSTHAFGPESLLAVCEQAYHRSPQAVLVGVRGYEFDIDEGLSPGAQANSRAALEFIKGLIQDWKEGRTWQQANWERRS